MESSKPAYEPVSTEEEPAAAETAPENAADTAPIVETTPAVETPPDVAEKNEKNAEKSAETEKEKEAEKKEDVEQNGNVSLDLDSSIVPLKEAEEVPHTDGEPHANGKVNGENGMVSIEMNTEELEMEVDADLKTKKKAFHCPKCPKCPSMPAWRPTKWTPAAPPSLNACSKKEAKEVEAEEGNVVPVEEGDVSHAERYKWIAAVSFLLVALLVVILVFVLVPRQEEQRIALHHHQKIHFDLHLNCDCPDNDLDLNAIASTVVNGTSTTASAAQLTTLSACVDACEGFEQCVATVFDESSSSCALKTACEKMTETAGKLIAFKS